MGCGQDAAILLVVVLSALRRDVSVGRWVEVGIAQLAVVAWDVTGVVAAASVVGVGALIGTVSWVALVRVVIVVWIGVASN